ncbi:sugar transferase [Brumicola blandensis]|uniref:Sugar transferase n=1 Tax=Brumicola blandensis TaxID=3075611 RepID=A0AAW8R2Y6_9ALTE|nr:sugar transferase [Alteromonas sp. W409]MDT0582697.1 sugar transferase [Alteromonas sp. W409]
MIRTLDLIFSFLGLVFLLPVMAIISILIMAFDGPAIFSQKRLGRNKRVFTLYKFRTMKLNTESKASHLVASSSITGIGKFLRKTKLDELPQLFNVLTGEMSLVGPRPNLESQKELINERDVKNVFNVRPGITGLAQINHIDMSNPKKLATTDSEMIANLTIRSYFYYILKTITGGGAGDAVK